MKTVLSTRPVRIILYLFIILAVLSSNYFVYRIEEMPAPPYMVFGSLFDLLVVIPLVTYFMIIRKKHSWKLVVLAVLAGYFAGTRIIPSAQMEQFSYIPKVLIGFELLIGIAELYFLIFIARKIINGIRKFKQDNNTNIPFAIRARRNLYSQISPSPVTELYMSEWTMFYFAFWSWRKKKTEGPNVFTYHEKTGFTAMNIMLIHAIALESVGFHYILHQWNVWMAYVILVLNIYTMIFLISHIQGVRKQPFVLTDQELVLQVGITKGIAVPLENIQEIRQYDGPDQPKPAELKETFEAYVADFVQEKPQFEILLNEPQDYKLMYGIKRKASRILIRVDNPSLFYDKIRESISETA
ncbi:hypothetical protein ACFFJY_16315 [Fictibacillus aquaticus]|uniref:Beta-carotene 15,15'-monooxygenase n=1 Tax=Fictibacillus aquaticus TaxID=2021314 RepID=A0A235F771_9BACL|nr:hypothetical protein [Fictibacillus aquaticus]OYD56873.1 hypothetical protein CGZ90_15065 [Fictibacillus aquaticus]